MDLTRRQQGGILRGYPDCNPLRIGENASVWYCYFRMNIVEIQLMGFLRALGYDCVAGGMNSITSGTAIATATGMLEHARMGQVALAYLDGSNHCFAVNITVHHCGVGLGLIHLRAIIANL